MALVSVISSVKAQTRYTTCSRGQNWVPHFQRWVKIRLPPLGALSSSQCCIPYSLSWRQQRDPWPDSYTNNLPLCDCSLQTVPVDICFLPRGSQQDCGCGKSCPTLLNTAAVLREISDHIGNGWRKNTSKATHTHTKMLLPFKLFICFFPLKCILAIRKHQVLWPLNLSCSLSASKGHCCFLRTRLAGGCGQGKQLGEIPKFNSWHWDDVSKPQVCHGEALQRHRRETEVLYHPPAPAHSRYREGITGTGERATDQE